MANIVPMVQRMHNRRKGLVNRMKFIDKLQRKFGRFAIPNLMLYVVAMYGAGFVLNMVANGFYEQYLALNIDMILKGQVWRIVTFLLQPPRDGSILFLAIELYFYYWIGSSLENTWGAFRFNLYFFSGILFNILGAVLVYVITTILQGVPTLNVNPDLYYINRSMYFAFAAIYPNVQVLFMFIIPIKVKWLAIFYAAFIGVSVVQILLTGNIIYICIYVVPIIAALINFMVFFFSTRNYARISPSEIKRKSEFRKKMRDAKHNSGNVVEFRGREVITRHKCAVCGRTELDDENLEFRFCSKCDGNYEYCMDHLYTHEHVKKEQE